MTVAQRMRLPLLVAVLVIVVDQLTKWWILSMWPTPQVAGEITLIPWLLSLVYIRNDGVAFGFFQGVPQLFTITSTLIIAGLIVFYLNHLPAGNRLIAVLVGLIIGGAIGNVIDRLRFGYVVDFIKTLGGTFAIFNIADSAVSVGVVGLAVYLFVLDRRKTTTIALARDDGHA